MFYVGLHQPADAQHFDRAFISVNRVRGRQKPVPAKGMDFGQRRVPGDRAVRRLSPRAGGIRRRGQPARSHQSRPHAAVSQDWMCEAFMLEKTGLTLEDHQRLTIERYDALLPLIRGVYLMPVLQGYSLQSYLDHIDQYGERLRPACLCGRRLSLQAQRRCAADRGHPGRDQAQAPRPSAARLRPQDDGTRERRGARLPRKRRQHGVVVCSSPARARLERLARGARVRARDRHDARSIRMGVLMRLESASSWPT
jgi:hypothetical protein